MKTIKEELSAEYLIQPQDETGYGDFCIHCPRCGEEFTHIERVWTEIHLGADEAHQIQGTNQTVMLEGSERRSALAIEFSCESCENSNDENTHWVVTIQQHKGINFVYVR